VSIELRILFFGRQFFCCTRSAVSNSRILKHTEKKTNTRGN